MTIDSQPDFDRGLKVVEGERSSVRGTRFGLKLGLSGISVPRPLRRRKRNFKRHSTMSQ